jgi:hypothetical protein
MSCSARPERHAQDQTQPAALGIPAVAQVQAVPTVGVARLLAGHPHEEAQGFRANLAPIRASPQKAQPSSIARTGTLAVARGKKSIAPTAAATIEKPPPWDWRCVSFPCALKVNSAPHGETPDPY